MGHRGGRRREKTRNMAAARDRGRASPTLVLLLLVCAAQLASAFRIVVGGAVVPGAACRAGPVQLLAGVPTAKWTLPKLRKYVKDNELDIKTSGPGRNKAAILRDLQIYQERASTASVQSEEVVVEQAQEEVKEEAKELEEEVVAAATDEEDAVAEQAPEPAAPAVAPPPVSVVVPPPGGRGTPSLERNWLDRGRSLRF